MKDHNTKTARIETEIYVSWVRSNPELLEPTVRKFLQEARGGKISVEAIDPYRISLAVDF